MAGPVLLRAGRRLRWVAPDGPSGPEVLLGRTPEEAARFSLRRQGMVPPAVRDRLFAKPPPGAAQVADPALGESSGPLQLPVAEVTSRRAARERGWPRIETADREYYLALAKLRIEEVLADPVEVLISLAREEERVERNRAREEAAAIHFLAPEEGELDAYRTEWSKFRSELGQHHGRIEHEVERVARTVAPNLSAVVGAKVAARLIARAGSLSALGRMSASKIQLLGSRRRPGPGRNPRFGVLYRAERLSEVPPDRQGAYARTLAALAATAARLDLTRPVDRSGPLLLRRDRRVSALLKRRRR